MNLRLYIEAQREWSLRTFGDGDRQLGLVAHIRKELAEIERDPTDPMEWVDVVQLALDGAWRAGASPDAICDLILGKLLVNMNREWPELGTVAPDEPAEHVRDRSDSVVVPETMMVNGREVSTVEFVRSIVAGPCTKLRGSGKVCRQVRGHEGECTPLTVAQLGGIARKVLG